MVSIHQIKESESQDELDHLVTQYLIDLGQLDQSLGESYAETASRLGGDSLLEAADVRWFQLI